MINRALFPAGPLFSWPTSLSDVLEQPVGPGVLSFHPLRGLVVSVEFLALDF